MNTPCPSEQKEAVQLAPTVAGHLGHPGEGEGQAESWKYFYELSWRLFAYLDWSAPLIKEEHSFPQVALEGDWLLEHFISGVKLQGQKIRLLFWWLTELPLGIWNKSSPKSVATCLLGFWLETQHSAPRPQPWNAAQGPAVQETHAGHTLCFLPCINWHFNNIPGWLPVALGQNHPLHSNICHWELFPERYTLRIASMWLSLWEFFLG